MISLLYPGNGNVEMGKSPSPLFMDVVGFKQVTNFTNKYNSNKFARRKKNFLILTVCCVTFTSNL